jgi:predicted protein tyrosine phosphatase
MTILVSPLSQLSALVAQRKPGRVISVLDPDSSFPDLGPSYADKHLRLSFHDAHVASPGVTIASPEHITQLLAFLNAWDDDESLLIHCRAGIGRSTATAYVAACHRSPGVSERRIANELRGAAPLARPNEHIIAIADHVMGRGGRMTQSIAETGRGLTWIDVLEGQPFEIASRFGAQPSNKGRR